MALIGINGYSGSGKDTVGVIVQYIFANEKETLAIPIEDVINKPEEYNWFLEEQSGWEIRKFADKLKDIAEHLTGIDREKFEDQEFKKTILKASWWTTCDEGHQPMTVREFLQKLGTDALRKGLHDNVWVNALMVDYVPNVDINTYRYAKGYIENRKPEDHEKKFPIGQMLDYMEEVPNPNWIITDTRFPNEAQAIKDRGGIIIRIDRPGVKPINNHPSEIGLDDWKFDYKIANASDLFSLRFTVEDILKHAKLLTDNK